jgi:hypothetical protein
MDDKHFAYFLQSVYNVDINTYEKKGEILFVHEQKILTGFNVYRSTTD